MPLSKKRNRDRMRETRLHNRKLEKPVQPKRPEIDADGEVIPEMEG